MEGMLVLNCKYDALVKLGEVEYDNCLQVLCLDIRI
jgi:hypothetical protein